MEYLNIEIKARCDNFEIIREILKSQQATFIKDCHQTDTYFKTKNGRLKFRESNFGNFLVFYNRQDQQGPKESKTIIHETESNSNLKEILINSFELLTVIDKQREIYSIKNVKIHLDSVENLGNFIEIEAQGDSNYNKANLLDECNYYLKLFKVPEEDLIPVSYSDLLLKSNNEP